MSSLVPNDDATPPPITEPVTPLTPEQAKLLRDNLGLVHHVANRAWPSARMVGFERDELVSIAATALAKLIPRFDPERGTFATFATTRVWGAIRDATRREQRHAGRAATTCDEAREHAYEAASRRDVDASDPLEPDTAALAKLDAFARPVADHVLLALAGLSRADEVENELVSALDRRRVRAAAASVASTSPVHAAVLHVIYLERLGLAELAERLEVTVRTAQRHQDRFVAAVIAALGHGRAA